MPLACIHLRFGLPFHVRHFHHLALRKLQANRDLEAPCLLNAGRHAGAWNRAPSGVSFHRNWDC